MMQYDCAIIGAGPAGLEAALTLGRARRTVIIFDNDTNRNKVTREAHGFITRDQISPSTFRELGKRDLANYSNIHYMNATVEAITQSNGSIFEVKTKEKSYHAKRLILATGMHESYPEVPEIQLFYGKSLFSCPYCDGWELQDKPLIIIADGDEHALHLTKVVYHWSKELMVATNGYPISNEIKEVLKHKKIPFYEEKIKKLHGDDGYLTEVELKSGEKLKRSGGFIAPLFFRANSFAQQLGCELKSDLEIDTDILGRTSVKNIYAAGEGQELAPSSLILSAADGYKAAYGANSDMIEEEF
ncbi:NAD(P)/FAD-dependent oxidoreductase [Alkalihalobacillus trypoxylicola]|uniref:Thioredoxin reductase n=1 Tax=Alkalihalobacillus trypoxylicola TaxID=519424 RepID=A0A162FCH8_9BACI|nr:NAD(P)/FAD-dependent oxidoreductase [Alkalihalobacillus trypoxylicola]KYG35288.1 thioredoxin reductase [Alkalihalobacillus trypoxylicola]